MSDKNPVATNLPQTHCVIMVVVMVFPAFIAMISFRTLHDFVVTSDKDRASVNARMKIEKGQEEQERTPGEHPERLPRDH
jgi:hypothetical protein